MKKKKKFEIGDEVKVKVSPETKAKGIAGKLGKIICNGPGRAGDSFMVRVNLGNTKAIHNRVLKPEELELVAS